MPAPLRFVQLEHSFLTGAHSSRLARGLRPLNPDGALLLKWAAAGLMAHVWDWAQSAAPSGVVEGDDAPAVLADALGWLGDADALVDAMASAGLVERVDAGLRLRGWVDRYAPSIKLRADTDAFKRNVRFLSARGYDWARDKKGSLRAPDDRIIAKADVAAERAKVEALEATHPTPGRKGRPTKPASATPAPAPLHAPPPAPPASLEPVQAPQTADSEPSPPASLFPEVEPAKAPEAKPAAKPAPRKRTRKDGTPTDPRHAPLIKALEEAAPGFTFKGGRDAKAVSTLLAYADAKEATRGENAPAEVVRRWRIGWAWRVPVSNRAPVQSLHELVDKWDACRSEETAPPAGAQPVAPRTPSNRVHVAASDAWTELDLSGGLSSTAPAGAFAPAPARQRPEAPLSDADRRKPHPGSDWSKAPLPEPVPTVPAPVDADVPF